MEFTNKKGVKWYLHMQMVIIGRNKIKVPTYHFKKRKDENFVSLPVGYKVMETNSGLPFLKKL